MPPDPDSLLRVHAGALNGHDVESLAGLYLPGTRLVRDGRPVGEGRDALRALEEESTADIVSRIMDIEGQPAIVGWTGAAMEGRGTATSIMRLRAQGGRVVEVRIDHDEALIRRLVDSARR